MKKIYCILNPLSGGGASLKMIPFIEEYLEEKQKTLDFSYEIVKKKGDLLDIIAEVLRKSQLEDNVVIAGLGGDGTHHALINGIMQFRDQFLDDKIPPYAVLPLGTGNNIAKSLGLKPTKKDRQASVYEALECALSDHNDCFVDLGQVKDRWFLDAFTIGIDADILAGRNRDHDLLQKRGGLMKKLFTGYPLYVYNTFKSILTFKKSKCEIFVDDNLWYSGKVYNILINNSAIYAGELDLTNSSPMDDGKLDIAIFPSLFNFFFRYLLGNRGLPRFISAISKNSKYHIRGMKFLVKIVDELPTQIAGEEFVKGSEFIINTSPSVFKIKKIK